MDGRHGAAGNSGAGQDPAYRPARPTPRHLAGCVSRVCNSAPMPREWDATTYGQLVLPHEQWGKRVVDRLAATQFADGARVMDAGCGTGRDAALVRERWPGTHLVAVDGSQQMLDAARDRLGDQHVDYVLADLERPLPIEQLMDAVISVAAFHWIEDQDKLFANLVDAMRPGAPLISDCGGRGNVTGVNAAIARVTGEPDDEWEFADADDTRLRLERAGFDVARCALRPDPFRIQDPDVLEAYLSSVVLGSYLTELGADDQHAFVRAVREALIEPVLDYVRLEIDASRR